MGVNDGDELRLLKREGYYIILPIDANPLKEIQDMFQDLQKEHGYMTEQQCMDFMREVRQEHLVERRN